MKIRVLMVTESLIRGGKERRLIELLRAYKENTELDFRLVLLKNLVKYPEIYTFENTEISILPRRINKDPRIFIQLLSIGEEFRPDIIHSWGSMPTIYSIPLAKWYGVPLINAMIADAICTPFKTSWRRAKITFPFSKIILANSHAGIKAYKVKEKKARVIHNGFNKDRLHVGASKKETRKKLGIYTPYVLSMIGAFHPRKDWDTFFKAAENIVSRRKDVTFIGAGDGELFKRFKEKFRNNEQIKLPGRVSDIEGLIRLSDIGVLTSNPNIHAEGISNSIMETMAFGKPVIATDSGGTPEIIDDGENGYLIPKFNVTALTQKIENLLENPELMQKMGNNAKIKVENEFSIEKMNSKYLNLYKELLRH
jgi:glycosyltransferase involved in cell wall biosynthesis